MGREAKGTGRAHRLAIRSSSEILHWFKQLSSPHLLRSAAPLNIVTWQRRRGQTASGRVCRCRRVVRSLYTFEERSDGSVRLHAAVGPDAGEALHRIEADAAVAFELRFVEP